METIYDYEVRELALYIENDEGTYRNYLIPVAKNLAKKYDKGIFVYELAVKGFGHVTTAAAKNYRREQGSPSEAWFKMFPKPARDAIAATLTDEFLASIRCGDRWWQ